MSKGLKLYWWTFFFRVQRSKTCLNYRNSIFDVHVMSRCDLNRRLLDLELLQHFGCHMFKICTKFERNRIIHGWVIDDLACFSVQFGAGQNWQSFLRGAYTQLHQTWQEHWAIIAALHFCFRFRISCCYFQSGWLKVEWCLKLRQISHFLTL